MNFFGGGHYNHTFFWESLAPKNEGGGHRPEKGSDLYEMMTKTWGTFENFQDFFSSELSAIKGSGWGWLVYNHATKCLEYRTVYNQGLITELQADLVPLLNIDAWEHAFYVDYSYAKGDYFKKIWDVVNWPKVEKRLHAAKNL